MRNLIKKILKEEKEWFEDTFSNIYTPKVGDIFLIPDHGYHVKITEIECDKRAAAKEKIQHTVDWGSVPYIEYGCLISYETDRSGVWESKEGYGSELGWVQVLIDKGYWVRQGNINEQEDDFDWIDLPEQPKDDSYAERVRYALDNTEFKFVYHKKGDGKIQVVIYDRTENPSIVLTAPLENFTRMNVLSQSQRILSVLDKQKRDTRYITDLAVIIGMHERLYKILKQID